MKKAILFTFFVLTTSFINGEECKPEKKETVKEELVETIHKIDIGGQEIKYKASAGTLLLKDEKDETKGSFFYVAYTKDDEVEMTKRPVTFCFNGGPGSSSIWLHMGVFGPKRVEIQQSGITAPPYTVVDNPFCFLDVTDLVFIDPISTGWSRVNDSVDVKQYHGVEEDIKSVGEFIRLYITRNNRWESPKFLAGESYGTMRAAGLAGHLHDELSIYLNGLVLVSSVLNFQTIDFEPGNDLPYILFLPSYTAAAWFHHKLDADLQDDLHKTLEEVENFAMHEYAQALLLGDLLEPAKQKEIAAKLARYTGLSAKYIELANLRVSEGRFAKELLRDQRRTVGRFDSRFVGIDLDSCSDYAEVDPSADAVFGVFAAAFNNYIRSDLKWEKDAEYKVLANVFPWDFGRATNKYLNVGSNLREVMAKNPNLSVFVANGYFDLATPYFATEYTFNHLGLDPSLKGHVSMDYYDAGHMMYIHSPSLEKFKCDVSHFILDTLKGNKPL